MSTRTTITVSDKQQRQAQILTRLGEGRLTPAQAAHLLGVSPRHLRRLRARFDELGIAALVHGNTGRAPKHKTDPETAARVVALASQGGPYHDFNVCHLTDLLAEHHDLNIGRSTLERLLKQRGLRQSARPIQRARRHERRERKPAEGMLVQMDGSSHDWLEGRGPRLCLVGSVDDATSKALYLRFHESESQSAYLLLLRTTAIEYGLPMSVYHDKHTILRSPAKATIDDELAGRVPMSQVQRVLFELGVESIAAQSPQAKGRIERVWQTLQDRLLKEMRLAGVCTMEGANAFLPGFIARFNVRFGKEPREVEPVWVPLPEGLDVAYYFSAAEQRTVRADQTLSFRGKTLRLRTATSLSGRRVSVRVTPEGEVFVYDPVTKGRLDSQTIGTVARPSVPTLRSKCCQAPTRAPDPDAAAARRRAWLLGQR